MDQEQVNFKWTHEAILLLLESYNNKKESFRDPKQKKKDLWKAISDEFLNRGYEVSPENLDKKFRNLKQSYLTVKERNKRSGNDRVKWEYYHIFEEIFLEDKCVNFSESISSTITQLSCPDVEFINENSSSSLSAVPPSKSTTRKRKTKVSEGGRELIELEKVKVAKLSDIADSIKETNKILKKLVEVLSKKNN